MRALSELEQMNTEYMNTRGIQYVLVCLTPNILHHGILDAKVALRNLLRDKSVHDYGAQRPGDKITIPSHILTFTKDIEANTSMYKAGTRGDARMWFGSEIYKVAKPDDIIAIIPKNGTTYVLPITHIDLEYCCTTSINNPIKQFFKGKHPIKDDLYN